MNWWESHYDDKFRDNEKWSIPDKGWIRSQVSFFQAVTNVKDGNLLDLGAGIGGHVALLTDLGFCASGIEFSEQIIAKSKHLYPKNNLLHGDMRVFESDTQLDLITFFDTSFGLFNDSENIALLKRCYKYLKDGGILYIDYLNPDFWEKQGTIEFNFDDNDEFIIQRKYDYDRSTHMMIDESKLINKAGIIEKTYSPQLLKLYPFSILQKILQEIGFFTQAYGSDGYRYEPSAPSKPTSNSAFIGLVAIKTKTSNPSG